MGVHASSVTAVITGWMVLGAVCGVIIAGREAKRSVRANLNL